MIEYKLNSGCVVSAGDPDWWWSAGSLTSTLTPSIKAWSKRITEAQVTVSQNDMMVCGIVTTRKQSLEEKQDVSFRVGGERFGCYQKTPLVKTCFGLNRVLYGLFLIVNLSPRRGHPDNDLTEEITNQTKKKHQRQSNQSWTHKNAHSSELTTETLNIGCLVAKLNGLQVISSE